MGPEVTEHTGFLEFTLPRHSEQEGGWGGGGGISQARASTKTTDINFTSGGKKIISPRLFLASPRLCRRVISF